MEPISENKQNNMHSYILVLRIEIILSPHVIFFNIYQIKELRHEIRNIYDSCVKSFLLPCENNCFGSWQKGCITILCIE